MFENCKNLKSINLPTSLKYVGTRCYKGSGITSIQIPEAGVWAEENAFNDGPAKSSLVFRDDRVFPKG